MKEQGTEVHKGGEEEHAGRWRRVWGVICDRRMAVRVKAKVYKYGLKRVALMKRQEVELKMFRF